MVIYGQSWLDFVLYVYIYYETIISNNINTNNPDLPQSVTMSRDGETIYKLTNCGQVGRYGPSQGQCDDSYFETDLESTVILNNGIQEWIGFIGIKKIIGSYNNVVGLPTAELYQKLKLFI